MKREVIDRGLFQRIVETPESDAELRAMANEPRVGALESAERMARFVIAEAGFNPASLLERVERRG
jgi:hypothetical protein